MCVGLSFGMSTPRIRGMTDFPLLALALLVPGIAADHEQFSVTPNQLAVLADTLDARPKLHGRPRKSPHPAKKGETAIVERLARRRKRETLDYSTPWHTI